MLSRKKMQLLPHIRPPLNVYDKPLVAFSELEIGGKIVATMVFKREMNGLTRSEFNFSQDAGLVITWDPKDRKLTHFANGDKVAEETMGPDEASSVPKMSEWTFLGEDYAGYVNPNPLWTYERGGNHKLSSA